MSWTPRLPLTSACARQPLDALLTGRLDDGAGMRLAAHLDSCETCQQRLTQLAAEPAWWLDASRWLEPATPDIDPCVDDLGGDDLDEFDATYLGNEHDLLECGLLSKSDNPAMIGRLGRYEVKRVIGAGGTGIVLQAIDSELNRTVAIKVLSPTLAAHGPARKRFARESQAVAAVAHENVVAVHHVEAGGRVPYLVMQYIDGDSLQELVIRNGPLDATTTLRMTAQLAAALTAAHAQGLVHRDVKPANILVGTAGQRVWMTDFGLARAVDDASLTRTGFIAGTPHYMSPEQARGATVRSSSDLFGLGGVVYFMLTGRPPFRAERTLAILNRICTEPHRPVREVNPGVPPTVARLVDRLLAKSAGDRFANAEAVRAECLQLLANEASPDNATPVVLADARNVAPRRARRSTAYQAIGAAVALLLLTGCLTVIVHLAGQLGRPLATAPAIALSDSESLRDPRFVPAEFVPAEPQPAILSSEYAATAVNPMPVGDVAPRQFYEPFPTPATPRDPGPASFDPVSTRPASASQRRDAGPTRPDTVEPPAAKVGWTSNQIDQTSGQTISAAETIDDDAAVWQRGLNALEQAFQNHENDLAASDDALQLNQGAFDPFDGTVYWIDAMARELEHQPALLPATAESVPLDDSHSSSRDPVD